MKDQPQIVCVSLEEAVSQLSHQSGGFKKTPNPISKVHGVPHKVLEAVPQELAGLKQWLVAKISFNETKSVREGKDKFDKRPVLLDGKSSASSTNPQTWFDLPTVVQACNTLQKQATDRFYHRYLPGLVLVEGGGYYGLDFDDCCEQEGVHPTVLQLISPFITAGCYVESSCSGRGLRVIGKGAKSSSKCKYLLEKAMGVEVYDKGRFLVITGGCFSPHTETLTESQAALDQLQADLEGVAVDHLNYEVLNDIPTSGDLTPPSVWEWARLKTALITLSTDDFLENRDHWLFNVVVPIKRRFAYGDEGLQAGIALVDEYSSGRLAAVATPTKYHGLEDVIQCWNSVSNDFGGQPKTLGSLFHHAQAKGWVKPRYQDLEFKAKGAYLDYTCPSTGQRYTLLISDQVQWEQGLRYDRTEKDGVKSKTIKPILNNYARILTYHPTWVGVLAYNELISENVKLRNAIKGVKEGPFNDVDLIRLKSWFNHQWPELDPSKDMMTDAITLVATDYPFHPIRDYLSNLPPWDGHHRIDRLLVEYGGAEDTPYTRFVTRKYLIGAVARVIKPGCKMDYSWCLVGDQGLLKSTFLETLAVNPEWYHDVALAVDNKDMNYILGCQWFIEFGEMTSMRKSDVETVKQFLTKKSELYRKAYDRFLTRQDRLCVFSFTGNNSLFLSDPTGNRRFWPVTITEKFDIPAIANIVDQLWAEALAAYLQQEAWYPTNAYEDELCTLAQESHVVSDPLDEKIYAILAQHELETILSQELVAKLSYDKPSRWDYTMIRNIMIGKFKCTFNKNLNALGGRGTQSGFHINRERVPLAKLRLVKTESGASLRAMDTQRRDGLPQESERVEALKSF